MPLTERLVAGTVTVDGGAERRLTAASWQGGPTLATDGETVNVQVADTIAGAPDVQRHWADFFTGLVHNTELQLLTVYVVPGSDVAGMCGGDPAVLGCYGQQQLVIPNEPLAGIAPDEIARHEYGHHVAFNRQNPPWRAVDWGPKRWASQIKACSSTKAGALFPGDEGEHYRLNPGEAWAETYRALSDQKAGIPITWPIVSPQLAPDPNTLAAAEQDVLVPWTASTIHVERRRFRKRERRWTLPVQAALDGDVKVTLTIPRGRLFRLSVLAADGKTVLAPGLWTAATAQAATLTLCGDRSFLVRVEGDGRPGRFTVVTSIP